MPLTLQKLIANSNYYSRRQVEKLILSGQVSLNGRVAKLSDRAEESDLIKINDLVLDLKPAKKIYLKFHKPIGYTCTNKRFPGEKNVFDLIQLPGKLIIAGRLDKDSSGLLILTSDGDFALKLSHPRFEHKKIYEVRLAPFAENPNEIVKNLRAGVNIGEGDGTVKAKQIKYLQTGVFIITLSEGKKRQIRRMFGSLGLKVEKLKRLSIAGIELGDLPLGKWLALTPKEINSIKK